MTFSSRKYPEHDNPAMSFICFTGFTGQLRNPKNHDCCGVYEILQFNNYGRVTTTLDPDINGALPQIICVSQGYDDGVLLPAMQFQVSVEALTWLDVESCDGTEDDVRGCVSANGVTAHIGNRSRDVAVVCFNDGEDGR